MMRKKAFWKNVLLVVGTLVLFFGLFELGLRVFQVEVNSGQPHFYDHNLLIFRVVSDKAAVDRDTFVETGPKVYPIHSSRYRSGFGVGPRPRPEHTILTIGDSSAYGWKVKPNETFSYHLEQRLNARGAKPYRVFNFGYPGYSSFQGRRFLERYIRTIRPRLVVAWFGANDGCYAPFESDLQFYEKMKRHRILMTTRNFLYDHFRFYRFLRNINLSLLRSRVDRSFGTSGPRPGQRSRVSPREFKENLTAMKEICRQNRCRMIFIWHCWLRENRLVRHEDYEPIRPYLDLFRLYAAQGKEPGPLFADFCHPSQKGHVLISRKLEDMIVNGGG